MFRVRKFVSIVELLSEGSAADEGEFLAPRRRRSEDFRSCLASEDKKRQEAI